MKKAKLALIAIGSVIGIGGAVAATTQNPGDYYTSATGSNLVPGQFGQDWKCEQNEQVTCAYLELPNGSRTKITGDHVVIPQD